MSQTLTTLEPMIAGLVRAICTCCTEAQPLTGHPDLDATQLLCPSTRLTYLDRGDGLFEPDGGQFSVTVVPTQGATAQTGAEPDVLSDRPRRTGSKVRIELERATFAGFRRAR
ncbi:MAG: hypothetical protein ABIJ09_04225 [Pseudomonadota bacterium]